jgi:alkanesulfonate monooxygenase SsuD/methylene tetrahydromethanopterin reductase-like flavin-dependent oxidoreductase (luciferase family)
MEWDMYTKEVMRIMLMQYDLTLLNIGTGSDAGLLAELAVEAEKTGWDGVFVWDCISVEDTQGSAGQSACDPWIALAAIALRTERIRFGPMVTPLSRRCPWKVARETVTLDHLSHGRLSFRLG